jgi:hypothetical protein
VTAADSAENRPTSRSRWNSESDNDLKKKASHQGGNPICHGLEAIGRFGYWMMGFRGPSSESEKKASRMEFEQPLADVFPILLDYMYSPKNELNVTLKNIPAVMALADYLDIASVRNKIPSIVISI